MGRPPMPWQRDVWDVALEVQSEAAGDPEPGAWAYDDALITVERQAGKTTGLRPVVVHRCGRESGVRVFMTAQKREKARLRWLDATDDMLRSVLGPDVKRLISNGHEVLEWLEQRSKFSPFAPNEDDLHGESPDMVVVDEWWAFEEEQTKALEAAYVPGFATKNGQAWKLSTAGTRKSWALNRDRRKGRRAVEQDVRLGTYFYEHSLPDVVDGIPLEELTDDQLVEAAIRHHAAYGFTLRPASVWSAWRVMDGDRSEFLRGFGNRTAESAADSWRAIDVDTWTGAAKPTRIPADAVVSLGFDVDPERRDAGVVASWRGPDGVLVQEVLRRHVGTRWVAAYVAGIVGRQRLIGPPACNPVGAARDVADELATLGVELDTLTAADFAAACQRHASGLEERTWSHPNDPDLNAAAEAAGWRKVASSFAWSGDVEPVSTLCASSLSGWAFDHPGPEPEKPTPRFWMA